MPSRPILLNYLSISEGSNSPFQYKKRRVYCKKKRATAVTVTMIIFGSPAFLDQMIRDFLPSPYDKFGFNKLGSYF